MLNLLLSFFTFGLFSLNADFSDRKNGAYVLPCVYLCNFLESTAERVGGEDLAFKEKIQLLEHKSGPANSSSRSAPRKGGWDKRLLQEPCHLRLQRQAVPVFPMILSGKPHPTLTPLIRSAEEKKKKAKQNKKKPHGSEKHL